MAESVLVVAFDGLDIELIEKYGLENVRQEEFGRLDNHTGITRVMTGELFASFITGETWEVHGVRGLRGWDIPILDGIEQRVANNALLHSAGKRVKKFLTCLGGIEKNSYSREDLKCDTVFDSIPDSRALNVPSYNENAFIDVYSFVMERFGISITLREGEKEFSRRKEELWKDLDENDRDLLVAHFHFPDAVNHLLGEDLGDMESLREYYERVDDFAGEIVERGREKYDILIFMSDHGMPTETAHNRNAFYSCNGELFGDETPHITDFRKVIEARVGVAETSGIDI